jgi:ADP-ribose pyrophosphatase
MPDITRFEIVSDERFGEGGFLQLRRCWLRNVRTDGTRSEKYICDFVERPRGLDAIAVVIWRQEPDRKVRVLIRAGLRPPLQIGRPGIHFIPLDEPACPLLNPEIVAGLVEPSDHGEAGLRRRAAIECAEETGYPVSPEQVVLLGAGAMPVPGLLPEREYFAAVEVSGAPGAPSGDGSPMEEGAGIRWWDLEEAISACVRGEISDFKTELGLRRFRDWLSHR